jgi:hypothetical protein
MAGVQAILGAVALIVASIAVILALTMLVLVEARWTLRLWLCLCRRWNSTIRQLQDARLNHDHTAERQGGRLTSSPSKEDR